MCKKVPGPPRRYSPTLKFQNRQNLSRHRNLSRHFVSIVSKFVTFYLRFDELVLSIHFFFFLRQFIDFLVYPHLFT